MPNFHWYINFIKRLQIYKFYKTSTVYLRLMVVREIRILRPNVLMEGKKMQNPLLTANLLWESKKLPNKYMFWKMRVREIVILKWGIWYNADLKSCDCRGTWSLHVSINTQIWIVKKHICRVEFQQKTDNRDKLTEYVVKSLVNYAAFLSNCSSEWIMKQFFTLPYRKIMDGRLLRLFDYCSWKDQTPKFLPSHGAHL